MGEINSRKIIQIACMASQKSPGVGAGRDRYLDGGQPDQLLFALVEDGDVPLGASIYVYKSSWLKVPPIDINCKEIGN